MAPQEKPRLPKEARLPSRPLSLSIESPFIDQAFKSSQKGGDPMERIETTDIFLSAFFICMGSDLLEIRISKSQNIASFLIAGNNLARHNRDFASGRALVNPAQFRTALNWLRDVLFKKLRANKGRYENDCAGENRGCQKRR